MNNNSNNQRPSHARRRPESVKNNVYSNPNRSNNSSSTAKRTTAAKNTSQNHSRAEAAGKNTQNYRFEAGRARPTQARNMSAVNHVTSLTPADERKLARAEKRRAIEERKEEAWQNDVVRVRGGIDVIMLAIILVLLALGTITVFSASYPLAIAEGRDGNYYSMNQVKFLLIGGVGMFVMTILPIKVYKGWAPIVAYAASALLLLYTAVEGMAEGEA
ncbi:MAG: hypothetical protein E7672_09430, partial [Ruminococcaceae bacterium]|nr:hypothetical protein [Oscillospiraceae bacterium]